MYFDDGGRRKKKFQTRRPALFRWYAREADSAENLLRANNRLYFC